MSASLPSHPDDVSPEHVRNELELDSIDATVIEDSTIASEIQHARIVIMEKAGSRASDEAVAAAIQVQAAVWILSRPEDYFVESIDDIDFSESYDIESKLEQRQEKLESLLDVVIDRTPTAVSLGGPRRRHHHTDY